MTLNKILAAVDFSPSSHSAACLAARLASANGAELELVHVLLPPSPGVVFVEPVPIPGAITTHVETARLDSADRQLGALADELAADSDLDIAVSIRHGVAVDELREAARQVDLVAVGNEGASLIPHHVATELARGGSTQVLACPADSTGPLRRALVAVDFTQDAVDVVTTAAALVGDEGFVELFHVHPAANSLDMPGVNRDAQLLEEVAARTNIRAEVRGYVGRGQLGLALVERAVEIAADVIVIGVESPAATQVLGLAEKLIGATAVPILMVPTPGGSVRGDRDSQTREHRA